jgi:hypothetical protein
MPKRRKKSTNRPRLRHPSAVANPAPLLPTEHISSDVQTVIPDGAEHDAGPGPTKLSNEKIFDVIQEACLKSEQRRWIALACLLILISLGRTPSIDFHFERITPPGGEFKSNNELHINIAALIIWNPLLAFGVVLWSNAATCRMLASMEVVAHLPTDDEPFRRLVASMLPGARGRARVARYASGWAFSITPYLIYFYFNLGDLFVHSFVDGSMPFWRFALATLSAPSTWMHQVAVIPEQRRDLSASFPAVGVLFYACFAFVALSRCLSELRGWRALVGATVAAGCEKQEKSQGAWNVSLRWILPLIAVGPSYLKNKVRQLSRK